MKKVVYALSLLLVLVSCSNDDNPGHASLSFRANGVLHEYKNIGVVEYEGWDGGYDPNFVNVLNIDATIGNNHQEIFDIIVEKNSSNFDCTYCKLNITQASGNVEYSQRSGEPVLGDFTKNDDNGIVGSFNGKLYIGSTDEYIE